VARAVGEEFFEDAAFGGSQFSGQLNPFDPFDWLRAGWSRAGRRRVGQVNEVDELGAEGADRHAARRQNGGGEVLKELLEAELREGGGAAEDQHGRVHGTLSNIPGVVKVLSSRSPGAFGGRHGESR
jgi:hypothetical protein